MKPSRKFGVSAKLQVAFGVVAGLTVIAIAVSFVSLRGSGEAICLGTTSSLTQQERWRPSDGWTMHKTNHQ